MQRRISSPSRRIIGSSPVARAGEVGEQVEAGGAAHVEHRGAAAVDDADEAGDLEPLEGLAHGVPVDGEGGGELALGRQRVAGLEAAA